MTQSRLTARRVFPVLLVFLLSFVVSCRTPPPAGEGDAVLPDVEIPLPAEEEDIQEPEAFPLPEDYYPDYEDYEGYIEEGIEEPEPAPEEPVEEEAIEEEPEPEPPAPGRVILPEFPWGDFPWENFPLELDLPDFPPLEFEPPPPEPEPVEPPPPPVVAPPPPVVPPPPPPFLRHPEPVPPPPVQVPLAEPLPAFPERIPPDTAEEEIVFSRIVRATVGQIIEIPFRGTGWVYLGELANRRGLSYDSRRLDTVAGNVIGQSFIFRAEAPGTYIIRFFRQDFIRDYILNDHVQVIVGEAPDVSVFGQPGFLVDRGRVIAEPRWPLPAGAQMVPPALAPAPEQAAVPEAAPVTEPAVTAPPVPAIPPPADAVVPPVPPVAPPPLVVTPPAVPPGDSPADYVRRARAEFNAGRVEPALVILDTMRLRFPAGSDEAWLLYGQLLEANSPSRDIRLALEFYRRLVNEYPQSNLVFEALRRIAHLERFFFNIR